MAEDGLTLAERVRKDCLELKGVDIPISGGSGFSWDDPIVIEDTDPSRSAYWEHQVVGFIYSMRGDTDTNAAIYGQLAGAYYSYNAIPEGWLNDLPIGNEIKELTSKLLKKQPHTIIHTRFEEDGKLFKEFKR